MPCNPIVTDIASVLSVELGNKIEKCGKKAKKLQLHVFALVCMVGISSWMLINGVWGELAALVPVLPEGWNLPSYIDIAVEASNIAPLIYTILVSLLVSTKTSQKRVDTISTGVVIGVNTLICIVTAICWQRHPLLADHSGMLIFCVFVSGLAATLSTICMFAFASRFPNYRYTVMMQIGMVLSGTIPGIIGLIQSPGQPYQRFSVEGYFWGLFIIFFFCCICFGVLVSIRRNMLFDADPVPAEDEAKAKSEADRKTNDEETAASDVIVECQEAKPKQQTTHWHEHVWIDFAALFILNFVENGALTQLVTYAAMPFGSLTLEMCTVLSILLAPLACLIAIFVKYKPNGITLCVAVLIPFAYVLTVAKMAPKPFLCGSHNTAGGTLIVLFYVVDKIFLSYAKAALWARLFERAAICKDAKSGSRVTRIGGLFQQGGSFVGAILFFCLVNYTQAFRAF
jgi:riboflavin transporter 2